MDQDNASDNEVLSHDEHGSNSTDVEAPAAEDPELTTSPSITHGKRILNSMQPELTVCDNHISINLAARIDVLIILPCR